jgi:hypothetical protein
MTEREQDGILVGDNDAEKVSKESIQTFSFLLAHFFMHNPQATN